MAIKNKAVALTTDGWTSLANDAFVTVTAHVITEDWEMKDFVLKTGELRESHTAENVSKSIVDGLQEFGVQLESVVAVTTDNAANYVNAVEKHMKTMNVPCFAHTINLAVRKGLGVRSIENSVARLKRTAAYFNHSATASYLLEEKQKQMEMPKRDKLINACATRWNSTYEMISRALEQQAPVAAVIFDKKLSNLELSTSEWTQLERVKDILRPFKVSTVALSTDKYPTASAVLPMRHVLLSHLRQETDSDTAAVKEMKAKITADLNKRYPEDSDVFMFLNTASYLDPRFHCLGHLDHGRQQEVHDKVLAEITAIAAAKKSGESELPAPLEAPRKSSLSAMGDLFSQVYQQQTRAAAYDLHGELVQYEREPQLPPDADPLLWWKSTGSARYPYIAQVAKKYLTVPGTSVRSERVFSSAGNIVNKKRSALAADHVDRLVFLANNM
ncbi:Zinc finger BED domain-containing protein 1 [Larimichthys crocea]|uniref:Zinc finger BED domain-containing protein 1 n=1 Tax=Larimichthys crocea TaxID=215358 RepID=A0A6G0I829_LARCR|nr:Zinc finger BED domain-containing protein 1 [Larimichthys crocea]